MNDISPELWWTVDMPVTGSLKMLHDVIQAAMGYPAYGSPAYGYHYYRYHRRHCWTEWRHHGWERVRVCE